MADISRDDVATLIENEYSSRLLASAAAESGVLSAFPRIDLGTRITNMPVLASLPNAAWVGESATDASGVKPTAEATWANRQLVVEEVAVIIPVHENTLDDATTDLLESLTDLGGTAIGRKLDQAVIFGVDKPLTWTSKSLLGAATAASNLFPVSSTAGEDDLAGSIYQAAEIVDDSGADPTTILSRSGIRYALANLRNSQGGSVWQQSLSANGDPTDSIAGLDASYVRNGAWDRTKALAIVTDRSRVIIGVRQDVTVKFPDQATVGGINLAERDMVALRFKARYAYALGDTLNATGQVSEPVAAVVPSGGTGSNS